MRLSVVGIGPGATGQMTLEARAAIEAAHILFGYGPYLERLDFLNNTQEVVPSDNREELARAGAALDAALAGRCVAMISGGDPGVFAMAAAVAEALESGDERWRTVELEIVPGVTAMLSVAAAVGAPLGHDFCAISLSDNLKRWETITRRLRLVAEAGLAIALYNPISRARPWQLGAALDVLREVLPATAPVVFGRAVGRSDMAIRHFDLADADPGLADMATCVIIGSALTRRFEMADGRKIVYTPRHDRGAAWAG